MQNGQQIGDGAAITATNVSRRYGRTWALRDTSVSIPRGVVTGLVGPNGAGKSTLMRLLVGFDKPTSGQVHVLGRDPWRDRADLMKDIGYVPQVPAAYRELTVEDHLGLAAHYRKDFALTDARARIDQLGIDRSARAGHLSGGQLAQLSLTIALASVPAVLLLDEPGASLDPLARTEFMSHVTESVGSRTTVLSSHIVEDIEATCDYLVVLGGGRVLLKGSIPHLIRRHVLSDSSPSDRAELIANLPGRNGLAGGLWRTDGASPLSASLKDIVLAYLTLGRKPGGSD
jgi:ABC-2 type transport system ATP-binding protein